ncbi:tyrosine--tRNA ligase [Candidatus Xianfuyuplasma coldseepsis]|uniref:Tyrosine--tRNA ligase n=1 Tax=Candidatus Xianfuyuplasma coldseepsis TaxID=2782163 RepID=A0A7L7KU51_9MOLU|nr:tyrosine--tRNA ligase [Xianfuyuplasma coldseepsis]QMS85534.1 tyrosine--tRNA ligase [Xianfuyuplasma coldseepsis]
MTLLEELKWRELLFDVTDPELEDKLEQGAMTFYVGADPTADSLHVGHLISYLVSKRLQDRGHHPILVIGGGTGLIGDPSGRSTERQLLTLETSLTNAEAITKQVINILPTAEVVNNYDWISTYDIITFLRDIGKHFNIGYMMAKDSVKSRLEQGISFTEFSYQIIQSLDFMHLYKEHNCELQIGGQDQWGNITAGLELIRKMLGSEEKAYGFTWPLLTKTDGSKFGKTAGGAVWLDKDRTSVYEFFQYWINTPDKDAVSFLKKFTFFSVDETKRIIDEFEKAPHKRLAQHKIAEELTVLVHGRDAYESALRISSALFSGDVQSLSADEIREGFKDVPSIVLHEELDLVDVLIESGLASSKRQSREFISNNAISVNGEKIQDLNFVVSKTNAINNEFTVLRRGKKKYALIKHGRDA